jgi:TatD DNase family protein
MNAPADTHFHLLEMRNRGIDIGTFLESAFPKGALKTAEQGDGLDAAPAGALSFGLDIGLAADDACERSRLAEGHPGLFLSVGMFPGTVREPDWRRGFAALDRSAAAPRVIAIGETGIDLHWKYGTLAEQIELFEGQIHCANARDLPIIVHTRDADAETLETLRRIPPRQEGSSNVSLRPRQPPGSSMPVSSSPLPATARIRARTASRKPRRGFPWTGSS